MGNRRSQLQQLAVAALEVSVLTVHGIVHAGHAVDRPEERLTLLERLERQQTILEKHAPDPPNIWHALLAALLDLVQPVFAGKRPSAPPSLEDVCSLLGRVPEGAGFAETDVATQMLQVVVQMMALSAAQARITQEQRLARQTAIVSSVLVVHGKLLEICEELENEEYVALQRLFKRLFGVYQVPTNADRFASASRQSATEAATRNARRSTQYGAMNTQPRARKKGYSTFLSLPGPFGGGTL